jgi:hypothetical protein
MIGVLMPEETSSPGPVISPAPAYDPILAALQVLIETRRRAPETVADLADPVRREWLRESAIGQDLKVSKETLRLLDILCWSRQDPAVLLSPVELVVDLGRQLAQIATLAIYLHELTGVTFEELGRAYEAACGIENEPETETN